jgi:hypothetical protein
MTQFQCLTGALFARGVCRARARWRYIADTRAARHFSGIHSGPMMPPLSWRHRGWRQSPSSGRCPVTRRTHAPCYIPVQARRPRHETLFQVLRLLEVNPQSDQRDLAESMGMSLGTSYSLKALLDKTLVKIGTSAIGATDARTLICSRRLEWRPRLAPPHVSWK